MLEITNVGNASARLDPDEKCNIRNPDVTSAGGKPNLVIVNESGLYSLILTSRKQEAKRFKKSVTADVIPSIRKHGGYIAGQESVEPIEILACMLVANGVIANKDPRLAVAEPKADATRKKVQSGMIEHPDIEIRKPGGDDMTLIAAADHRFAAE